MVEKPSYEDLERQIEALKKTESEFRQKQAALRESEQKFQKLSDMLRLMCDNVPDMIWAKDLEKRFTFANNAICKDLLNAADTNEPIGRTDLFFAERERNRFPDNPGWHTFGEICRDSDQITMEAGRPMQFDEFGNVKGQFLFLDVHKAPFIDENGNMIGTVGSARDITGYKRFEKELIFRKNIIESSSCAIATCDLEGKMTYGNTFFQQLWAFDNTDDFLGRPFYEMWLLGGQHESIMEILLSGKNWSGEIKAKKKDGTIFYVQVSAAPVFDNAHNVCSFTSTSIDITECKRTEDELHASEQKHRRLFETMAQGVIYQASDGAIISANPAAERILGQSFEQMQGKTSMYPLWKMILENGTDVPGTDHPTMIALQTGETVGPVIRGVFHPDKRSHVWLSITATPLFQPGETKPFQVYATFSDITELKEAQDNLKKSHDRIEAIYGALNDAIVLVDSGTRKVIECNSATAKIFGYTYEEILGKDTCLLHVDQEHFEKFGREAIAAYAGRGYYLTEFKMKRKDGSVFPTEHYVRPVLDSNSQIVYVVSVIRDITDRKRLHAQLSQLQKAESLGRMAGAIAHHFNNQLSVVMGNLELVLDDLPDDAEYREILFQSFDAGRKAAEISQQMLRYLCHVSGSQTTINLSDVCRQSLAFLQSALPKSMTLNVDFPVSGPVVHADAGQIQQVLTNLLTNAQESLPDSQGVIDLSIRTVSHEVISTSNRFPLDWQPQDIPYACLEISDTGCGISKEDVVEIFDPFYTTKFTGRGMGLPVTMGILKTHGGCISVVSEGGRGSVFRVYLPVTPEKEQ